MKIISHPPVDEKKVKRGAGSTDICLAKYYDAAGAVYPKPRSLGLSLCADSSMARGGFIGVAHQWSKIGTFAVPMRHRHMCTYAL